MEEVGEGGGEALVICTEKMSEGIKIFDLVSGKEILRIPTCASPPHGLLPAPAGHLLVASQLQKHRPYSGGAIFSWALSKPQTPIRSYTMEVVEPLAMAKNGIYLAGGAPSGNAYLWNITTGRLLKNWNAHRSSVKCLAFSQDDSFLISTSEDDFLCIWSMISLLDLEDPQRCGNLPYLNFTSGHLSSITSLLPLSRGFNATIVSSSLDGTCKVWDIISGRLLQTHIFSNPVTVCAVDPTEQLLVAGRSDGEVLIKKLGIGMQDDENVSTQEYFEVLHGHRQHITALTFSLKGQFLISASMDCTICVWDTRTWQSIRKIEHEKGYITNLSVVSRSAFRVEERQKNSFRPQFALLDKTPQPIIPSGMASITLPALGSQQNPYQIGFQSSKLLEDQILDLESDGTPDAIQMKVEMALENRLNMVPMMKHMININKNLQSRLLDMIECQLFKDHSS